MDDIYLDAIRRANKLGAKGVEVIAYSLPETASSPNRIILYTKIPDDCSSGDLPWYEK